MLCFFLSLFPKVVTETPYTRHTLDYGSQRNGRCRIVGNRQVGGVKWRAKDIHSLPPTV